MYNGQKMTELNWDKMVSLIFKNKAALHLDNVLYPKD